MDEEEYKLDRYQRARFTTDPLERAYDFIDRYGYRGWRDREAEGRVRDQIVGLWFGGLLEREKLLAEMRSRGHDEAELRRLSELVDKVYAYDYGPRPLP